MDNILIYFAYLLGIFGFFTILAAVATIFDYDNLAAKMGSAKATSHFLLGFFFLVCPLAFAANNGAGAWLFGWIGLFSIPLYFYCDDIIKREKAEAAEKSTNPVQPPETTTSAFDVPPQDE